jgi:hypothetical protein
MAVPGDAARVVVISAVRPRHRPFCVYIGEAFSSNSLQLIVPEGRMRVALGVLIVGMLAGCASTMDLQRQSARGIEPHPYPDSVTVSDVHGAGTQWVARTSSGVYDCSLHANEDHALCVKRQTAP